MIEENVQGAIRFIKESRMRLDVLESRLKDYTNISALQDALGEPLTRAQKQVHLARFTSDRSDFQTTLGKLDTMVDASDAVDPLVVDAQYQD